MYLKTTDLMCSLFLKVMETLSWSELMNVEQILWFLSADTDLVSLQKIFCRENCGNGNVLIETTENSAENGRYSIEYVKVHGPNIYSFSVKISALTESDSGRYRCGLGQSSESYQDFTLTVSGGEFLINKSD
uniref:Immunoglobulin V-set domain-containing protein n=1 Tax=Xiphophorus couchianus TaxID=32473 RepID=A0A3B5MD56_9TELE